MTALGVVLLVLGAAVTALMPLWALLTWSDRRERRRIARLSISRCADVARSGQRLCVVEGRSRPAAGPLTAPLSGEPCVWYFSKVTEDVDDDLESSRLVWETGGAMAFAVQDETGSVLVDGSLVHPGHPSRRLEHRPPVRRVVDEEVRSPRQSTHLQDLIARGVLSEKSFERGWLSGSRGWTVREYVLPAGEPLHVQARLGFRDGRPVLGDARRKHLVTGHTQAQLIDHLDQGVRTGAGCLLLGLVGGPLLFVAGYLLVMASGG